MPGLPIARPGVVLSPGVPAGPRGRAVVYLSQFVDLYSRRVVGVEVNASCDQAEHTAFEATAIGGAVIGDLWDGAYTTACPQLWPWRRISTGFASD